MKNVDNHHNFLIAESDLKTYTMVGLVSDPTKPYIPMIIKCQVQKYSMDPWRGQKVMIGIIIREISTFMDGPLVCFCLDARLGVQTDNIVNDPS